MIIIKKYLYCVYIWNIFQYQTLIMIVFYIQNNISYIKENMMCQDSNGKFNNKIKFKFNQKIYIKIMSCKIVRFQKLMWRNMMRLTKSQKVSVLHYSIDQGVRDLRTQFNK